jgi:hypothetical protein
MKKILKSNGNENTICQKPMGHNKGSAKGKLIVMSSHSKNTERSKINNLMLHLKLIEK